MANQAKKPLHSQPRLGRGLSSLIGNPAGIPADEHQYQPVAGLPPVGSVPTATTLPPQQAEDDPASKQIPTDHIASNPFQPRREFDNEELNELANSIARQGILQPLIVALSGPEGANAQYVLIAGERRLRAARQIGRETVPCLVRHATRQQMLEWALAENIHRADLNPMERAKAFREYVDRFGLAQIAAAEQLCLPRTTVANYLRLLELHRDIQQLIAEKALTFGHAKVLAGMLDDPDRQLALGRKVVSEGLSVRQLERLVRRQGGTDTEGAKTAAERSRLKPPYIRDLEEQLTQSISTRVSIMPGRAKHTGRVVVEYYSLDDFDRIAAALGLNIDS